MSIWDKVQKEIDRAGTVAKGALDEGKIRIELFRVRQQADKAAQALGYALHRAKKESREVEAATLERLHAALMEHDAEAKKLEEELASVLKRDGGSGAAGDAADGASDASPTESPPPA